MTANELVAFILGSRVLCLPIAPTYRYNYSGPDLSEVGALSLEDPDHWGPWQEFEALPFFDRLNYLDSCRRLVANLQALRDVVVFDIWIRNTDRHFGNILVNEREEERRYEVAFIDHSHALLGPNRQYEGAFETVGERAEAFLRTEEIELAKQIVTHPAQVQDAVARVSQLSDEELEDTVGQVATALGVQPTDGPGAMISGLKRRRNMLASDVDQFLSPLKS